MTNPQDAPARLAAYRAAREASDPAAIRAASRAPFAAMESDAVAQAMAHLRDAYEGLPDDAEAEDIARAEADAWLHTNQEARRAILLDDAAAVSVQPPCPLTDWRDADEPAAVLWRHDAENPKAECWPLVSVGEPAILSGAGGTGKSYVALALALSAVQAGEGGEGDALGFGVRGGPVLLAAYEDSGPRLAGRVGRIVGGRKHIPDRLHVMPDPGPLFVTGGLRRPGEVEPTATWAALWQAVEALRPSLIVLDPAAELIEGADANQPGPVRAFMRALAAESERHNAGVLIVAHDTKEARNNARDGTKPGAGAVAGSAAWQDRARGVAYMGPNPTGGRSIEVIKSNHGRDGWGMTLAARQNRDDGFAGWQLANAWTETPPKDADGNAAKPANNGKTETAPKAETANGASQRNPYDG